LATQAAICTNGPSLSNGIPEQSIACNPRILANPVRLLRIPGFFFYKSCSSYCPNPHRIPLSYEIPLPTAFKLINYMQPYAMTTNAMHIKIQMKY